MIDLSHDELHLIILEEQTQDAFTSLPGVPLFPEGRKQDIGKMRGRIRINGRLEDPHIDARSPLAHDPIEP